MSSSEEMIDLGGVFKLLVSCIYWWDVKDVSLGALPGLLS
jgi:hypothetical protein